jgi:hypothetical protein
MVTSPSWRTHQVTTPSNKGMKLTSAEHIGRSQLIPGVRRTVAERAIRAAVRLEAARERVI